MVNGRIFRAELASSPVPDPVFGRLHRADLSAAVPVPDQFGRLHRAELSATTVVAPVFGRLHRAELAISPSTAYAGLDRSGIEQYTTVSLTGTGSGTTRAWTQLSGPTVTLTPDTASTDASSYVVTFTVPGSIDAYGLVFQFSVDGVTDSMAVSVLASRVRAVVGGVEVPANWYPVSTAVVVPPVDPPDPPVEPTPGLFFKLDQTALKASTKMVMAHYFPPYPVSIDNADYTNDYYTKNYLRSTGESGTHAAYGGWFRDRPWPRSPRSGAWQLADAKWEVQNAYDAGIDGFFPDLLGAQGLNWDRIVFLIQAVNELFPDGRFKVIPMLDANGSTAAGAVSTAADRIMYHAGKASSYYLPDGRFVVSCFKVESKPLSYWQSLFADIKTRYGVDVAFLGVYSNTNLAASYGGQTFTYGTGIWGQGADPNIADTAASIGTPTKLRGEKFLSPVWAQDMRSRNSLYDEAFGTGAMRRYWEKAIREQADWVQICTWSDFSESAIMPTVAHGWVPLDISAYYITKFKTGVAPTILKDAIYLSHRRNLTSATITGPQTAKMAHWSRTNMSAVQNTVEVLTFLTAPATVTLRVGSNIYTYTAPAGMNVAYYPSAVGQVSVEAARSGVVVSELVSPILVVNSAYKDDYTYFRFGSLRGTVGQYNPSVD